MSNHLVSLVEKADAPAILVVGDIVLDRYVWGDVGRVSPEGPIPVLHITSEERRPGGAGNVVSNLLHLGASVSVCGATGDDKNGVLLTKQLKELGADTTGIIQCDDRPTAVKTRYMGFVQSAQRAVQHMLRVDHELVKPIAQDREQRVLEFLEAAIPRQQAVVLSDYDKGMLTERVLARAIELARAKGIPVVTDPKMARPYSVYAGSSVITPNRYETKIATGIAPADDESLTAAAEALRQEAKVDHVVITLDRDGMYVAGETEPGARISVRPREVYDVNGAGDMVVSAMAMMLAVGASMTESATIANVASSIEVTKLGAAPVSRSEIVAELLGGMGIGAKIKTIEDAVTMAEECRRRNGKVVWTNGCFDILHIGHYEYLRFSREQGDMLIVGLNSDASVRRLKGEGRPITGEAQRARILSALDVVDAVVIFGEDTPTAIIETLRPEVLVKGADYQKKDIVGGTFVESYGGKIVRAPIVEGVSTTNIVQRILELHANSPEGT